MQLIKKTNTYLAFLCTWHRLRDSHSTALGKFHSSQHPVFTEPVSEEWIYIFKGLLKKREERKKKRKNTRDRSYVTCKAWSINYLTPVLNVLHIFMHLIFTFPLEVVNIIKWHLTPTLLSDERTKAQRGVIITIEKLDRVLNYWRGEGKEEDFLWGKEKAGHTNEEEEYQAARESTCEDGGNYKFVFKKSENDWCGQHVTRGAKEKWKVWRHSKGQIM